MYIALERSYLDNSSKGGGGEEVKQNGGEGAEGEVLV